MRTVTLTAIAGFLAVLATSLLGSLPIVAGGLLAAGAVVGSWAGWKAGLARRPRAVLAHVPSGPAPRPGRPGAQSPGA
jgi:hypothetical protein